MTIDLASPGVIFLSPPASGRQAVRDRGGMSRSGGRLRRTRVTWPSDRTEFIKMACGHRAAPGGPRPPQDDDQEAGPQQPSPSDQDRARWEGVAACRWVALHAELFQSGEPGLGVGGELGDLVEQDADGDLGADRQGSVVNPLAGQRRDGPDALDGGLEAVRLTAAISGSAN